MAAKITKWAAMGAMAYTLYFFYPEMRRYLKFRSL